VSASGTSLETAKTPCLVLDRERLVRNTRAMTVRMAERGVALRPHLKTAKSAEVARIATQGNFGGIAVSTLAEARYFAERGFGDQTYAVGIAPSKLEALARLARDGVVVRALTDDAGVAREIGRAADRFGVRLRTLVEVDCGLGRGGVPPESDELLEIARILHEARGVELDGVLTHAGHAYGCAGPREVERVGREERDAAVRAAERLRADGLPCPIVSAGSTPTAIHAKSCEGLTELRPGNYVFFDLFQVALGSCRLEDLALTVLATVIGRVRTSQRVLVDAGSLALSSDTSASVRMPGVGHGLVADLDGTPRDDGVRVVAVNQEHGFLEARGAAPIDDLPVGSRVRILPNHACITAAMHDAYHVVDGGREVVAVWARTRGW